MDPIKLEFPDGVVECNILGGFQVNDTDYLALTPQDGEDVFIYGYTETDGKIDLRNLSESEFTLAAKEFQRIMEEFQK
ncbi:MAG: DUF1292 domain-containing protein [Oscillospiraceae bacterium]|nr:DUF1292 domain-containing protein [Oscillospiraceae bacterium]